jgi:hypothetical protein
MPNFTVISRDAHSDKRWQRPNGYAFAAKVALLPLFAAEMGEAAMSLPLAFAAQEDEFQLVSVLGLATGENLFVTQDGRWLGRYVPAALRSYPFRLADTQEGQQVLCFDTDSGLLNDDPAGEAFLNADGTPAAIVAEMLDFLGKMEANRGVTVAACAALQARKLLVPWNITVQRDGGEQKVEGLYRVDEAALISLPDEEFVMLRENGALALAYCQLLSMQHLPTLAQLAQAHADAAQAVQTAPVATTTPGELNLEYLNRNGTLSFGGLH